MADEDVKFSIINDPPAEDIRLPEYRRLAALENAIQAAPILRTQSRQEILRDARIFEDYLKDGTIPE